ncbi:hypothetical protein [Alistipes indistinctus]|jgi:hypothetical protein|uniref:hypothetical protein n=1 Tax=Alistipes indistinctus TaxID=626932 RepID=UPI0011C197B6|nr:hypothetical protein [Alistipes indistinctus]DAM75278.1 MAG TPA: hypothetical protein [Caudoviricetes sp.]
MKMRSLYRLDESVVEFIRSMQCFVDSVDAGNYLDSETDGENSDERESLDYMRIARGRIVLQYRNSESPIFDYFDEIICKIEDELMVLDDNGRKAFLTQAIRFAPINLCCEMMENATDNKAVEILQRKYPDEPMYDYAELFTAVVEYLSSLKTFILDYDLEDRVAINKETMDLLLSMPEPSYFSENRSKLHKGQSVGKIPKYETMPSTHRRATVMALIDKSGLCKNIDKTKKAAFVEAVTGGNIKANPKDTVSYRKPEQKAIDAATELLKTIGIE